MNTFLQKWDHNSLKWGFEVYNHQFPPTIKT